MNWGLSCLELHNIDCFTENVIDHSVAWCCFNSNTFLSDSGATLISYSHSLDGYTQIRKTVFL